MGLVFLTMMIFLMSACSSLWAKPDDSDLQYLKIQLEGEKDILSQMQAKIADLKANAPECSRSSGGVHIQGDPIGDAHRRIAALEQKIAAIENKNAAIREKSRTEKAKKVQAKYQGKTFKTKKHWWEV